METNSLIILVISVAGLLLAIHLTLSLRSISKKEAMSKDKKTVYSLSPSDVVKPNPMITKQMQDEEDRKPFINS